MADGFAPDAALGGRGGPAGLRLSARLCDEHARRRRARRSQVRPAQELSPLLADPPQFVLLHFEVYPDGCVTSPQNPTGDDQRLGGGQWAISTTIDAAAARLEQLKPALVLATQLLAQLPEQPLPAAAIGSRRSAASHRRRNRRPIR